MASRVLNKRLKSSSMAAGRRGRNGTAASDASSADSCVGTGRRRKHQRQSVPIGSIKFKSSSVAAGRRGRNGTAASDASSADSCVGIARRRKRQRQSVPIGSIGGKLVRMPHKWTTEETKAFVDAAMGNISCFRKRKFRTLAISKIHDSMKGKFNVDLPMDIVKTKFYTCMTEWRKFKDLKSIPGSNFNPETGAFDASDEWWQQRKKDDRRFKKHRPYWLEFDKLFKHMEEVGNTSSGWDSDYSGQYRCSECRQSVTPQSVTPQSVQSKTPTLADAIKLVKECGVDEDTHLFHTASKAMMNRDMREMFALIEPGARLVWLQHEHNEKVKTGA